MAEPEEGFCGTCGYGRISMNPRIESPAWVPHIAHLESDIAHLRAAILTKPVEFEDGHYYVRVNRRALDALTHNADSEATP